VNICSRLPLVGVICGVVCSFALSANAVAQQQEIYPNPLVAEVVAAGAVSLDVMYDVSDADATLTGMTSVMPMRPSPVSACGCTSTPRS